jgi:hypothetical protein
MQPTVVGPETGEVAEVETLTLKGGTEAEVPVIVKGDVVAEVAEDQEEAAVATVAGVDVEDEEGSTRPKDHRHLHQRHPRQATLNPLGVSNQSFVVSHQKSPPSSTSS